MTGLGVATTLGNDGGFTGAFVRDGSASASLSGAVGAIRVAADDTAAG